jgi:hypothetical protein
MYYIYTHSYISKHGSAKLPVNPVVLSIYEETYLYYFCYFLRAVYYFIESSVPRDDLLQVNREVQSLS